MRKLMIAAIAVAAGASLASAQGTISPLTSGPGAQAPQGAFPGNAGAAPGASAPVGHRQPRRADVPDEVNVGATAEDRALDRKIKSICRGC